MKVQFVRRMCLGVIVLTAAVIVPVAGASQVISTSSVTGLVLGVNDKGEAMVTYTPKGTVVHVLAFGGVNALAPVKGGTQTALTLDYDGGYQKEYTDNPAVKPAVANLRALQQKMVAATAAHNNPQRYLLKPEIATAYATLATLRNTAVNYYKTFTCPGYDGTLLAWQVAECQAPDGSFWAVQEWQRQLPDYGVAPTAAQSSMEVHLSHWTGPLPVLTIQMNWAYKKFDHLFGTFTYLNGGVYGFASTPTGAPLDKWGRNLYVDTYNSAYGHGWVRDNSFLTHKLGGTFCYGFYAHGAHPSGKGEKYRATIVGPGLTPDIMWSGNGPGAYDATKQAAADQAIVALGDPLCKQV